MQKNKTNSTDTDQKMLDWLGEMGWDLEETIDLR